MMELLATLGFSPRCVGTGASEVIETIAPPRRVDVEREIDLIEEICRLHGLDAIPVADTISVRVPTENPVERGTRAVKDLLVGMGYIETVTHTLIGERAAEPFLMHGAKLLKVDDERAGGEGALRPSVVASLLRVRRHNLDQGAHNLRLFEFASAFHYANGTHVERPTLAMLADMPEGTRDAQIAYRLMRGMVERVLALVVPRSATIAFVKSNEPAWLSSCARIVVDAGRGAIDIGCVGLVDTRILKANGIDRPTAACELQLRTLLAQYPPLNGAVELPAFPASERDISAIVADGVEYAAIEREIVELQLPCLESVQFVTTFRGKQIGEGKKSVSLRLLFRASDRTLRSEEADGAVARAVTQLRDALGAEIRS